MHRTPMQINVCGTSHMTNITYSSNHAYFSGIFNLQVLEPWLLNKKIARKYDCTIISFMEIWSQIIMSCDLAFKLERGKRVSCGMQTRKKKAGERHKGTTSFIRLPSYALLLLVMHEFLECQLCEFWTFQCQLLVNEECMCRLGNTAMP